MEHLIKFLLFACQDCGDCTLTSLGFLCPQSRCAKYLLNGPCGGSRDGWCEIYPGRRRCLYVKAYERLAPWKKEEQFKFVDHHNCRLGKWYYEGDGKENFANTKHYSKLESPHATVHNGTHKVFELMVQENVNIDDLVAAFKEMEDGSNHVFSTLDEILHDKDR